MAESSPPNDIVSSEVANTPKGFKITASSGSLIDCSLQSRSNGLLVGVVDWIEVPEKLQGQGQGKNLLLAGLQEFTKRKVTTVEADIAAPQTLSLFYNLLGQEHINLLRNSDSGPEFIEYVDFEKAVKLQKEAEENDEELLLVVDLRNNDVRSKIGVPPLVAVQPPYTEIK